MRTAGDRVGARDRARTHDDRRGARRGRRRRLPRARTPRRADGRSNPGRSAFLFTHLHVRDDALVLYGFPTRDERDTFEVLIGASGVGPKLALADPDSVHTPGALRRALLDDDVDALTLVPGVGKRTAQRMLVDLKARLDAAGPRPHRGRVGVRRQRRAARRGPRGAREPRLRARRGARGRRPARATTARSRISSVTPSSSSP